MKFGATLKKHGLKIVIAVIVILFIYYVYTNQYMEHLSSTTYTTPRICIDVTNKSTTHSVTLHVYAVNIDNNSTSYVGNKVSIVTIPKNTTKTVSFKSGSYGFMLRPVTDDSGFSSNALITVKNLVVPKKVTKRGFFGKKKTTYNCEKGTLISTTLTPDSSRSVVDSSGTSITGSTATTDATLYNQSYVVYATSSHGI